MLALLLLAACAYEPTFPGLAPELVGDQDGTDVILTVRLYEGGDPGLESRYDLVHVEGEVERPLLGRHAFDPEDASSDGTVCLGDSAPGDTAAPSVDGCDSDCSGDCVTWYGFEVADPCHPPGQVTYELRLAGEQGFVVDENFYVMDMGTTCEGGCSSLPTRPAAFWLSGLMALGLAQRRRRR